MFNLKPLSNITPFLVPILLFDPLTNLVSAASIPLQDSNILRRPPLQGLDTTNLETLKSYVCPRDADNILQPQLAPRAVANRQSPDDTDDTVPVPESAIVMLQDELLYIVDQLSSYLPESASSTMPIGSMMSTESDSTMTIHSTRTIEYTVSGESAISSEIITTDPASQASAPPRLEPTDSPDPALTPTPPPSEESIASQGSPTKTIFDAGPDPSPTDDLTETEVCTRESTRTIYQTTHVALTRSSLWRTLTSSALEVSRPSTQPGVFSVAASSTAIASSVPVSSSTFARGNYSVAALSTTTVSSVPVSFASTFRQSNYTVAASSTASTAPSPVPITSTLIQSSYTVAASSTATASFVPVSASSASVQASGFLSNTYPVITESATGIGSVNSVAASSTTTVLVPIASTIIQSSYTVAASSTATASFVPMFASSAFTQGVPFQASAPAEASGQLIADNYPVITKSATGTADVQAVAAPSTLTTSPEQQLPTPQEKVSERSSNTSKYVFDPLASTNVAVYYGQTPATSTTSLSSLCALSWTDILILSFVTSQNYSGSGYPQIDFGGACEGQTSMMQTEAPGLLSCPELAANITSCQQSYGKKVLLSIGGSSSQIVFASEEEAEDFAGVLWKLFGPAGAIDNDLRPFGDVEVDGFDIDNESNNPKSYHVFGTTLKSLYNSSSMSSSASAVEEVKDYFLSSAPQCPFPDASIPASLLQMCDFVFIQFYDNPSCEIGSAGFQSSLNNWSTALPSQRLYIGMPSFSSAGTTAYAAIEGEGGVEGVVSAVKGLGIQGLGGVMLWDGSEAVQGQEKFLELTKQALEGSGASK